MTITSSVLAAGSGYPPITLIVRVARNPPGQTGTGLTPPLD
ncbi:hypothetical protein OG905_19480 [Streptomyces sp. NBC_00322]|nr:hypothetical protein [Streptomyces sp. NBC_00322]